MIHFTIGEVKELYGKKCKAVRGYGVYGCVGCAFEFRKCNGIACNIIDKEFILKEIKDKKED